MWTFFFDILISYAVDLTFYKFVIEIHSKRIYCKLKICTFPYIYRYLSLFEVEMFIMKRKTTFKLVLTSQRRQMSITLILCLCSEWTFQRHEGDYISPLRHWLAISRVVNQTRTTTFKTASFFCDSQTTNRTIYWYPQKPYKTHHFPFFLWFNNGLLIFFPKKQWRV